MKSRALKKTRAELAVLISRRCFPKYNEFVPADKIVANVHDLLLNNKDKFLAAFTARVRAPLYKITDDRQSSKRHCISFLRRIFKTHSLTSLTSLSRHRLDNNSLLISC